MSISIDNPRVGDESEALFLMMHHLQLAALYFEGTPDPIPQEEWISHFSAPAILAWLNAMEGLYPKD